MQFTLMCVLSIRDEKWDSEKIKMKKNFLKLSEKKIKISDLLHCESQCVFNQIIKFNKRWWKCSLCCILLDPFICYSI